MEVLTQKKRGVTLQFKALEPDPETISDDEYPQFSDAASSVVQEAKLLSQLDSLLSEYYRKTTTKDPTSLSRAQKFKKIP